jgi:hypothetical protein
MAMNIVIEVVQSAAQQASAARVRSEVFEREWGFRIPEVNPLTDSQALHLLAKINEETVAALTVIDTTGDDSLHARYCLPFSAKVRAARYTQLAVLKPFRGLNIPLALIAEGHRQFVGPCGYDYTWLLYNAERAETCSLRRLFGFEVSRQVLMTEYGLSKLLVRSEAAPRDVSRTLCTSVPLERPSSGAGVYAAAL